MNIRASGRKTMFFSIFFLCKKNAFFTFFSKKVGFQFEFSKENLEKINFPYQYENSSNFGDFKFQINPKMEFDDFKNYQPFGTSELEEFSYKSRNFAKFRFFSVFCSFLQFFAVFFSFLQFFAVVFSFFQFFSVFFSFFQFFLH